MKTDAKINNFIDGQFVEPIGGKYLGNIEPATGKPYSHPKSRIATRPMPIFVIRMSTGNWTTGSAAWQDLVDGGTAIHPTS